MLNNISGTPRSTGHVCDVRTHLSCEPTEESKNELREGEDKVLVEEVAQKGCHSVIGPATMHEHQPLQKPTHGWKKN